MLNVGLTGSIACGKTTVARMFVERGAFHIDFDQLAHAVEEPDQPAWRQIVACFGSGILNPDRTIDRVKLGAIVFEDKEKLARLNSIVHPAVFAAWYRRIEEIKKIRPDAIILSDIPLLIEARMQSLVDLVVLVYITPGEQLARLIKRNGYSDDEARRRLSSQMCIEDKLPHAQVVINNQGNLEETRRIIDRIWRELLEIEKRQAPSHQ
jgi:dephospho-CoA kinase